jgi:exopolysaccharide biosynthesis polyprenyl glycosylphosphotransferase
MRKKLLWRSRREHSGRESALLRVGLIGRKLKPRREPMSSRILRLFNDLTAIDIANEPFSAADDFDCGLTDEVAFMRRIVGERKRTERSARPFLLMLIKARQSFRALNGHQELLRKVACVLKNSTRETDSAGWYEKDRTIGVIFSEVGAADQRTMASILAKIANGLRRQLSVGQMDKLEISVHRYPDAEQRPPEHPDRRVLFPDLPMRDTKRRAGHVLKRAMDVAVSVVLLVLLSPLLLIIVLAIKLTSKGPVLFRQDRIGQYGIPFTFLKFRSMRTDSDPGIHRDYVSRLISGEKGTGSEENKSSAVYKITTDPRVTIVGRFLRRSSLDELPQLWNVIRGEMSLVGPRPPIPYEFECYDIWHRRRVIEAKPGLTGLWQVTGRSRTSFDDMVRLDLKYVSSWSIWLDLKILLQTPRAVFSGDGAY